MPRPNKPRTIGAEDAMRLRIREFLETEDRSGAWLARQVASHGLESFTSNTVHRILNTGRTIYVNEAIALADVMGVPVTELIKP